MHTNYIHTYAKKILTSKHTNIRTYIQTYMHICTQKEMQICEIRIHLYHIYVIHIYTYTHRKRSASSEKKKNLLIAWGKNRQQVVPAYPGRALRHDAAGLLWPLFRLAAHAHSAIHA